jgi:hypothetical protein
MRFHRTRSADVAFSRMANLANASGTPDRAADAPAPLTMARFIFLSCLVLFFLFFF